MLESFKIDLAVFPWIVTFVILVYMILYINDALKIETLHEFTEKFKKLVSELSDECKPCTFPMELVSFFVKTNEHKFVSK